MSEFDPQINYQDSCLYIILSSLARNADSEWHWLIFLPVSKPFGQIYHSTDMTTANNPSGKWIMEEQMIEDIAASREIVAALKVSRFLTEEQIARIHDVLVGVNVIVDGAWVEKWGETFNSRVWIKEALDAMRKEKLIPDFPPNETESEVFAVGRQAVRTGQRLLRMSKSLN